MHETAEISCVLFLALAAKYVSASPVIADAAALAAGQVIHWAGLKALTRKELTTLGVALRYIHPQLTEPREFLSAAQSLLLRDGALFELTTDEPLIQLSYRHQYRLVSVVEIDDLIQEYLARLCAFTQPERKRIPAKGAFTLGAKVEGNYKLFEILEEDRAALPPQGQTMPIPNVPPLARASWNIQALHTLAEQLDAASSVHNSHLKSLRNIICKEVDVQADAGNFYRVNAPTGSGKTVLMVMMAVDAARRGEQVAIGVPGLLEVEAMTAEIRRSLDIVAPTLTVAPLHAESRMAEMATRQFGENNLADPYRYVCLLSAYASDGQPVARGSEPCFRTRLVENQGAGAERSSKIDHCPFLFKCGKTAMLAGALQATIVVVNHDALLSASTNIPLEDGNRIRGRRSYQELLLRTRSIFLVDEIDGLLSRAIQSCTTELELGSKLQSTALARLHSDVRQRSEVAGIKSTKLNNIKWALTFTAQTPDEILDLHAEKHFQWPRHGMRWPQSEDSSLQAALKVDGGELRSLYQLNDRSLPQHLHALQDNLSHWSIKTGLQSPEDVLRQLTNILHALLTADRLKTGTIITAELKGALVLRGALTLIQSQVRLLHRHIQELIWADIPYAREVQNALEGHPPISLNRNGPLQQPVCGFKHKIGERGGSTLHIETLKGDPHATLQLLPSLTSLAFAGHERIFIGLSATAHFSGASRYDLPAIDLIDVPDASGQITFRDLPTTTRVSGTQIQARKQQVRQLAKELALCLPGMLAALHDNDPTRARIILVTNSDADAEVLAIALRNALNNDPLVNVTGIIQNTTSGHGNLGKGVLWLRGKEAANRLSDFPVAQAMLHHDLPMLLTGEHRDACILVSALSPIARGHNIVHENGRSAVGSIIVCVRPLPPSDHPADTHAHICYENCKKLQSYATPGEAMEASRALAYHNLNAIRNALPSFSHQPENVRHYTIMNILVDIAQLAGRGRRGETSITCFFADAAFFEGTSTWATLLDASVCLMRKDGEWDDFRREHAGIATAMENYILLSRKES
ncbi:hypothetical protein [Pseudomonas sp. GM48]|uniref:hypothetical protein n=1 Tax=Pseudomonas sp. GM48 TaxID=1144330 RepID=UPI00026FDDC1|nr:hypothetical protein [Pseudomonas sp. GM48]EJM56182.1 hypothetical protein PMI28_03163 [Pseudomonas sp. GM48]